MRGEIHLLVGAALAAPFLHLGAPAAALAAGALGSVLPDVDHPGSFLGRYVPWPAVTVPNHRTGFVATGRRWFGGRVIWHRGETHSLGAALAAGVLSLAGGLALDQGVPWAAWLALA
ncbi:MAG: metal-dependent hydrolase, partial [Firmicutes bacterium]|nr:metal-dependent hydrolase [Bacillota bacterium]